MMWSLRFACHCVVVPPAHPTAGRHQRVCWHGHAGCLMCLDRGVGAESQQRLQRLQAKARCIDQVAWGPGFQEATQAAATGQQARCPELRRSSWTGGCQAHDDDGRETDNRYH